MTSRGGPISGEPSGGPGSFPRQDQSIYEEVDDSRFEDSHLEMEQLNTAPGATPSTAHAQSHRNEGTRQALRQFRDTETIEAEGEESYIERPNRFLNDKKNACWFGSQIDKYSAQFEAISDRMDSLQGMSGAQANALAGNTQSIADMGQ